MAVYIGILIVIFLFACIYYLLKKWFSYKRYKGKRDKRLTTTIGFFHPYCNAGGGGERVLWAAIKALQLRYSHIHCVVYTGDIDASKEDILKKIASRFNITFAHDIEFVFLRQRFWVEAKMYPYFTLLFQSLASIFLGCEALLKFVPDIYIDTMGYAFTLPLFKYLGSCRVACYVHYPTISTDMLEAVSVRKEAVNNRRFISNSTMLSSFKLTYYKLFSFLYGVMGRTADVVMVNSSWTKGHIISLWKNEQNTFLVFPPCDVSEFENISFPNSEKNERILSIAQFRPEKNHVLQINSFHELLGRLSVIERQNITLVLVGSCRSDEDNRRVDNLKNLCNELGLSQNVEFKINLTFKELLLEMQNAGIALHTMWNEHFGIGIVECMSAGLIMIAHDSGGPKMDIVIDHGGIKTGFLASDINSYATAMESVLKMSLDEQLRIRKNARESVSRFSVKNFEESFLSSIQSLIL